MSDRVLFIRQIRYLGRRLLLIVLATIAGLGLGYVASSLTPRTYEAKARIVIGPAVAPSITNPNDVAPPQRLIQTYAELVETERIADLVAQETGISSARLLLEVQAVAPLESLFIDIIARDQDRTTAARIANAFANTLVDTSPDYIIGTDSVKLLSVAQLASPPEDPIAPRPLFDTVLGGMAGLMGGIAGVYVGAYVRRRVRFAEDLEGLLGRPTLGTLRALRPGRLLDGVQGSRELQRVRLAIEYQTVGSPVTRLLVASPDDGDGRTTIAAALALSFAQVGRATILVDGDIRRPAVAERLGISDAVPAPAGEDDGRLRAVRIPTVPDLSIVPSSFIKAPTVSGSLERVGHAIGDAVSDGAEVVIVDSPPLESFSDAGVIAQQVDAVILVIREGVSTDAVERARERLEMAKVPILGAILNRPPLLELVVDPSPSVASVEPT